MREINRFYLEIKNIKELKKVNLENNELKVKLLKKIDFYPIIFQDYGQSISSYGFERDVIFVKKRLLDKIFYSNY